MPPLKKNDALPLKGQKSLTSFFGAATSSKTGEKKPRMVQSGIVGAFKKSNEEGTKSGEGKSSGNDKPKADKSKADKEKDKESDELKGKENVSNHSDDAKKEEEEKSVKSVKRQKRQPKKDETKEGEQRKQNEQEEQCEQKVQEEKVQEEEEEQELMDTDDEEIVPKPKRKGSPTSGSSKTLSRKRIIDDSDDDDGENENENENEGKDDADEVDEADAIDQIEEEDKVKDFKTDKTKAKKANKAKAKKAKKADKSDTDEDVSHDEDKENESEEEYKDDEQMEEEDDETVSLHSLDDDDDEEEEHDAMEDDDEEEEESTSKSKSKSISKSKSKPSKSLKSSKTKSTASSTNGFFSPKSKKQKVEPTSKKTTTNAASKTASKAVSSTGTTKSVLAANGMKSDAALWKLMEESDIWKSASTDANKKNGAKNISKCDSGASKVPSVPAVPSTPYAALCNTFSHIESISSRLEIQESLTELFRMVLLREGGGDDQDYGTDEEENESMEDETMEEDNNNDKDEGTKHGNDKDKDKTSWNSSTPSIHSSLLPLLYLTSNTVAPPHACVELGVGDSILLKAIGEASGINVGMMKKKYEKEGDLGTVAVGCKGRQRTLVGFGNVGSGKERGLSCAEVLSVFRQIATTSGSQSQKWKVSKIKHLLVRAKGEESKYIIRGLQGKLRIGLAHSTVLASLAHAVVLTCPKGVRRLNEEKMKAVRKLDGTDEAYPDYARKLCTPNLPLSTILETSIAIIKKAYSEVPSFDSLLKALLEPDPPKSNNGLSTTSSKSSQSSKSPKSSNSFKFTAYTPPIDLHLLCTLTPGIPVEPMLAKPTKSVLEVLKRLEGLRFTCEYKYDGERAQVHMTPDGVTKVFSRSLLNTSEKFPEVPLYVQQSRKHTDGPNAVTSFVLDTEVVAFNRETGQFVPFQVLSTRKRKDDDETIAKGGGDKGEKAEVGEGSKVKVIVQAFDLMYLNGKSLLDRTLAERRQLLREHFVPVEGKFQFATSLDHTENGDTAIIEEFLDAAVKGQCEGLMVKTLDVNAAYEPSRRSLNWLKLKKDYLEGLGDSVDLVPLGAYHGKGKRTGVYGAYLLACYDQDTEEFQSVCKIGTGFSEEDLSTLASSLKPHIIPQKSSQYIVSDTLECDVWFDAVQVWEVKAADLSKSSTHKGAIDKTGESGRGIGLRFPRFERVRGDKKPEEATSSEQILEMYWAQDSIVGGGGNEMDEDGI